MTTTLVIWLVIIVIFIAVSSSKAKAQQQSQQRPPQRPGQPIQITRQTPSGTATGFSSSPGQADQSVTAITDFLGLTAPTSRANTGSRTPRAHAHGSKQRGPVLLGGFEHQNTEQPPAAGFGGVQTGGRPLGAPVTDAGWVTAPAAQVIPRPSAPAARPSQPAHTTSAQPAQSQAAQRSSGQNHSGQGHSGQPQSPARAGSSTGLPGSSLMTGSSPSSSLFTRGTVLQSSLLGGHSDRR